MISLDVEDKCHDCPIFECSLCKKGIVEPHEETVTFRTDMIITCKHKEYCTYLKER